ncbi:MAG: methylenetetrahydrofolate--tRNA-(uracil(54)-C(5))-methyltransferase (FADH(2)-oxidizing) TrmFO [Ruminococcaceae bacterium]|nr:methylenetetrahydrofolate--tRNA-(uracil(54)-C(5))-methyltransferase (FADH(2)-oxidizing) TrmFO [Oscillospiraceae bacterium]
MTDLRARVIGAGLAGCEAAWQLAERGIRVELWEMKPKKMTPAHRSSGFAELVCSNSLRSDRTTNGVGLLKEELRRMGSLILAAADATRVPAGSALAVDRDLFSAYVTDRIRSHPLITVIEEEVTALDDSVPTVVATGPLTADALAGHIAEQVGGGQLHFFDAAAPIVDAATVNMDIAYFASRYDKGDADYLNCPMDEEQYNAFYDALISAEAAELHDFDRAGLKVFEGCMPVEIMASRGRDTLRYGPLKPVGLRDPRTGREAYAVVQLRRENEAGTMYNLVGFQTHLRFPEQQRVFRMIPGLESAEFMRYGVMHRNTYLNSPEILEPTYALRGRPNLFFAGQMTGVEGYIESTGSGFVAGLNAARLILGEAPVIFPRTTMIGAMAAYVSEGGMTGNFQPMNANFGILQPLPARVKGGKIAKYEVMAARSLAAVDELLPTVKPQNSPAVF